MADRSADWRCPACANVLVADRLEVRDIWRCDSCDGIWIRVEELHAFVKPDGQLDEIAGLPVEDVEHGSRHCPFCPNPLRTAREMTTGTQVDWCDRHGVWLDARELEVLRGQAKPDKPAGPVRTGQTSSGEPGRVRGIVEDVAWFFGSLFVP